MIDALFGSKTRVKLLHLFLNNPDKAFYVREITRLIDEQINSVRRELANMMNVGVISSDSLDNKLYYKVNNDYAYIEPLKMIFAKPLSVAASDSVTNGNIASWTSLIKDTPGILLAVAAGRLVESSASEVDLLIVGEISSTRLAKIIKTIEQSEKGEINYAVMAYDDFYYRKSVRDRFVGNIIDGRHVVIVDRKNLLNKEG